jgi:hypothetical protein
MATPNDEMCFFGAPPWFIQNIDEVHISVTFTWDMEKAEWLGKQWEQIAPVKYGGPAFGQPSGEFIVGRYLRQGYTITSRGCPNHCWFCSVWEREPELIELPIVEGWNVLDDNLLACSESHIRSVFAMLKKQPYKAEFTGGLEAKLLMPWHIDLFLDLAPKQMFFAYDTPDDWEPLVYAANELSHAGIIRPTSHVARCYVLIGYKGDTIEAAEKRLMETKALGFGPMAMLWRSTTSKPSREWQHFQRKWARAKIIYSKAVPPAK